MISIRALAVDMQKQIDFRVARGRHAFIGQQRGPPRTLGRRRGK